MLIFPSCNWSKISCERQSIMSWRSILLIFEVIFPESNDLYISFICYKLSSISSHDFPYFFSSNTPNLSTNLFIKWFPSTVRCIDPDSKSWMTLKSSWAGGREYETDFFRLYLFVRVFYRSHLGGFLLLLRSGFSRWLVTQLFLIRNFEAVFSDFCNEGGVCFDVETDWGGKFVDFFERKTLGVLIGRFRSLDMTVRVFSKERNLSWSKSSTLQSISSI